MAQYHELPKTYNPADFEDRIYQNWCDKGYFTPDPASNAEHFSVVIPPPNVTGQLHMGHALDETLQDILVRHKRMQGYNTLWVPGTDHAGIATQIKVEENLRVNEGLTRYDLGREKFLERVWDWKHQYGNRITSPVFSLPDSVLVDSDPILCRGVRSNSASERHGNSPAADTHWCERC